MAVDTMPVRFFATDATVKDCSVAETLIAELKAESLPATRSYDTDAIIQYAFQAGMTPAIPPKKKSKVLCNYDKHIYKLLPLVENAFLHIKKWHGIATCYSKNATSFVAAVQIRYIALWLEIY